MAAAEDYCRCHLGLKQVAPKGLSTLREALKRVGIATLPSRSEEDYNAGRTTQVPTGRVVGVLRRVRRQIGYNGIALSFERAGPALRGAVAAALGTQPGMVEKEWHVVRAIRVIADVDHGHRSIRSERTPSSLSKEFRLPD